MFGPVIGSIEHSYDLALAVRKQPYHCPVNCWCMRSPKFAKTQVSCVYSQTLALICNLTTRSAWIRSIRSRCISCSLRLVSCSTNFVACLAHLARALWLVLWNSQNSEKWSIMADKNRCCWSSFCLSCVLWHILSSYSDWAKTTFRRFTQFDALCMMMYRNVIKVQQ